MAKADYSARVRLLEDEMMAATDPYEFWRQIVGGLTQRLNQEQHRILRINRDNYSLVGEDASDFLDAMSTIQSFAPQRRIF